MYPTHSFIPLQTVFGGGYVQEHHSDEARRYLPPIEKHEFVMDFDAVIKALRAALSLR